MAATFFNSTLRAASLSLLPGRRFFHQSFVRFADAKPASSSSAQTGHVGQLTLRISTPHEVIVNDKVVHAVTVPGTAGVFGVLSDHVPTIAQLKPGVVYVHGNDMADIQARYFVSGGFVVVNRNSTAYVTAAEAVRIEDLDAVAAKKGLDDSNAALARAATDKEKAEARVGIETYEAIIHAAHLGEK